MDNDTSIGLVIFIVIFAFLGFGCQKHMYDHNIEMKKIECQKVN